MSPNFAVNIVLSAGHDFEQDFYLAGPDKASMDITGCTFMGYIQKHPGAIDAIESTSEKPIYKFIPMGIHVKDGVGGVYTISVPGECTLGVPEGKYIYSVSMTDVNGVKSKVLSGLAFIDFGTFL